MLAYTMNGYAQMVNEKLRLFEIDVIMGKSPKLYQEIKKSIKETDGASDAILISLYQTLLGDYYQSKSDIGLAKKYWDESEKSIKNKYGSNSPFNALKYYNLSKYYSFLIKSDSALYFAEKAIAICRSSQKEIKSIRVDEIYKQYGYALKIKHSKNNDILKGTKLARQYFDSAMYFNKKYTYGGAFSSKLNCDIGNTYTDEIIHLQRLNQKMEAFSCFKKANFYYDNAIAEIPKEFEKTNQLLSNIYFVKGLTYLYCFVNDSLNPALENFQKGIEALTPDFYSQSLLSCPNSNSKFLNESALLVLLHNKIDAFYNLYVKTKEIKYLQACYEHSKVAFEVWKNFFSKLKTEEIHLATEIYGAAPFASSIPFCNEYYQITKDKRVAENVFRWMDLNKYSVLIKQQLDNGTISFNANPINITEIQSKLKPNQAIVEYYFGDRFGYAIITKDKFNLYKLDLNSKVNSKIDSFLITLKLHEAKKFCFQSKELYDVIFKPVKANLSDGIKELIIIPHNKLYSLPFDALVTNEARSFKDADFLIKHYKISYGLSCNLFFNGYDSIPKKFNSISYLNPVFENSLALPFSNKLTDKLTNDFSTQSYKFNDKTNNSILHLATHAYCDYTNSRNSYLLLNQNEKLQLNELRNKIYSLPLAVLSACETGNGNIEQGEGVINFSRQFYLAGVKSTITTLWKVDDEATANILEKFYMNLKEGKNSITALHEAKLKFLTDKTSIDDYDPYYWSGLVYNGAPVVYSNESSHSWYLYLIICVSICLLLLFLFRKKFFRN